MDTLTDKVNDTRSNIIELLLRLFKYFEERGEDVNITYENIALYFAPGKGLWLKGCPDQILVCDYCYDSVKLGDRIRTYNHLPYSWLKQILDGEIR